MKNLAWPVRGTDEAAVSCVNIRDVEGIATPRDVEDIATPPPAKRIQN